jgi:ribosome-associated protein YbcJ (S4-like RNA binding protein)
MMANTNKKSSFNRIMLLIMAALTFTCSNETGNYHCETANGIPENSIIIQFENENELAVYNPYENEISIVRTGNNVIVQSFSNDHNLVVSGTTENGSLKIYGNHRMGLYLNGANIANQNGPAINIQNRNKTSVHLVGKTENYLADGEHYEITSGEDAKGAFFSEGQVLFSGCGGLEITAKRTHAIAVDNALEIEGGNIKIETLGNGAKGIKTNGFIAIRGGTTNIKTHGNIYIDNSAMQPDTNSATGIKTDSDMEISGGKIVIKTFGTKAKGINVSGNLSITGGDIKVYANDDGVKVHGNLIASSGSLCAWSMRKQDIDCNGAESIESGTVNGSNCPAGF